MKLLHIDSSILGAHSVSRELTAAVAAELRERHHGVETVYRDLASQPLSHLSGEIVGTNFIPEADWSATQRSEAASGVAALEEFLSADVLVIGAPMYNFSIPSQLKSWIDRVSVAGRTFRYTDKGAEGMVTGKKAVIVSSRGGVHSSEQGKLMDFQEDYLKSMLGFLGITEVEVIRAEGVNMGDDKRAAAMRAARDAIARLAV